VQQIGDPAHRADTRRISSVAKLVTTTLVGALRYAVGHFHR